MKGITESTPNKEDTHGIWVRIEDTEGGGTNEFFLSHESMKGGQRNNLKSTISKVTDELQRRWMVAQEQPEPSKFIYKATVNESIGMDATVIQDIPDIVASVRQCDAEDTVRIYIYDGKGVINQLILVLTFMGSKDKPELLSRTSYLSLLLAQYAVHPWTGCQCIEMDRVIGKAFLQNKMENPK